MASLLERWGTKNEDLDLTAHLSREISPNVNQNTSGTQEMQRMDQIFSSYVGF